MVDLSRKIDVEKLISFSDDLLEVLKDKKDVYNLTQCLEHSKALCSSCNSDFHEAQSLLEDYQKKINTCKQKTEEAKSAVTTDAELDLLEKELEEEHQRERLLEEQLRIIVDEITDLDRQRVSIEERKQLLKKLEQDELRAQRKLSMYASVTNIIPNLDEDSKISGHIVERDRKMVQNFEYDQAKMSAFDTCDGIWKMINM